MAAYTRRNSPPQQVVMVTSVWSDAVDKLRSGLKQEMVTVIACAIEVAVKASVDMVIPSYIVFSVPDMYTPHTYMYMYMHVCRNSHFVVSAIK